MVLVFALVLFSSNNSVCADDYDDTPGVVVVTGL